MRFQNKKTGDYFVGLDIGTNSVGWAVTNEKYEILRAKNHRMWGSRLFEEGKTAEERRVHRAGRRRLNRRNDRLMILEDLFAEEISKVDKAFYQRLHESQYRQEHKTVSDPYFLFNDKEFTDEDYHIDYPTIYHLRVALMKAPAKDIRLLFLAIHHIIKYRGNFLHEGETLKTTGGLTDILQRVLACNEFSGLKQHIDDTALVKLLTNKGITRSDIAKQISELATDKLYRKQAKAFASLVLGLKANLDDLFNEPEYKELDSEIRTVEFSGKEYWEERDKYEPYLGESLFALDGCKTLYDTLLLSNIKPDGKYLSEAKVETFEKHHEHLESLKDLLKSNKALYNRVLRDDEKNLNNYITYIGKSEFNKRCSRDEFYKFLKQTIKDISDNENKAEIVQLMELDSFLPLLRVRENGVIPYQIHEEELEQILNVSSEKYPFLNKADGSGFTIAQKILKLLTFRIPYFVGPLNPAHKDRDNGFAWVVRKAPGKVYPWNFEDKVDISASATAFIENLTNKCTYLIGEDVLPKYSLAYSKFSLLNELNNLRYDGKPLSYETKQSFIKDCFEKEHRKMTEKRIREFLKHLGGTDGKGALTGLDVDIKSDLKSYRDMVRILGDGFDETMAERIIRYVTLFGEAKKVLLSTLEIEFGDDLSDTQKKQILKLQYRDWGRLSATLLKGIKGVAGDNPECSILECMEQQPLNLMEVLSSHNTYLAAIEEFNKERTEPTDIVDYKLVDDLYISPAVKRSVWQTLRILDEITKLRGSVPKKVFVEVARTNRAEKKKTDSRKERLLQLYKTIKDEGRNWTEEIKQRDAGDFNSKKLFLYYTQQGRCMYSGEKITSIGDLFTSKYDIDHIYPRSVTKDNSWDNLVLVKAELNREKKDIYPIEKDTQDRCISLWKQLLEQGLISERKYERLVRTTPLTADELADFVNRQLVETNQSVKAVTNLLKRLYPDTTICYVKAENVSDFRQEREFVKLRSLNAHHHAKDAYLNIVVGNVYHEKFTNNPRNFIKNARSDKKRPYSLNHMFDYLLQVGNKEIWNPKTDNNLVKKMMRNKDVQVTRMLVEQTGALYDATIYKASVTKSESYVPLKSSDAILSDVKKYGGFTSIKIAYYSIFRFYKKNSEEFETHIISIPVLKAGTLNSKEDYVAYGEEIMNKQKFDRVELVYKKLCMNSLVRINGVMYYLGGKTNNSLYIDSAISLVLPDNIAKKIKAVEKYIARVAENGNYKPQPDQVSPEFNMIIYKALTEKMKQPAFVGLKTNRENELEKETTITAFIAMTLIEQCKMLMEILNLLTQQKTTYALKPIGVSASRSTLGMNITGLSEFTIITQSVTGLQEKEIRII